MLLAVLASPRAEDRLVGPAPRPEESVPVGAVSQRGTQ